MTKDTNLFFIFFLLPIFVFAQNPIQNAGFEDWSGDEPVNWFTNNIPATVTAVTQSSNPYSGSYAVKGEIVSWFDNPYYPSVIAGEPSNPYTTVSQNYAKLSGYYQLHTTGADFILVTASLLDSDFGLVAIIFTGIETVTEQYLPFSIDFDYSNGNGNDAAYLSLQFMMSSRSIDSIQIGANFLIDDVEISGVTALESMDNIIPSNFKLWQNYPNPFNPSTTIRFNLPKSTFVVLKVFNIHGSEVETLLNGKRKAGIHEIQWNTKDLSSGIYFIKMITDEFVGSKKVTLLK